MAVNIWFSRKTAKEEVRETLFFSGMTYGVWNKDANGYDIETELGKLEIRSMYDIRLAGKKVGSPTDFKRVVGEWIRKG